MTLDLRYAIQSTNNKGQKTDKLNFIKIKALN